MSTGARRIASAADNKMAIAATMTVMGRRSARTTSHMSASCRAVGGGEQREIAERVGVVEDRVPDLEPRHGVIDLGLLEEALCLGDVVRRGELGLVTRRCLLL